MVSLGKKSSSHFSFTNSRKPKWNRFFAFSTVSKKSNDGHPCAKYFRFLPLRDRFLRNFKFLFFSCPLKTLWPWNSSEIISDSGDDTITDLAFQSSFQVWEFAARQNYRIWAIFGISELKNIRVLSFIISDAWEEVRFEANESICCLSLLEIERRTSLNRKTEIKIDESLFLLKCQVTSFTNGAKIRVRCRQYGARTFFVELTCD